MKLFVWIEQASQTILRAYGNLKQYLRFMDSAPLFWEKAENIPEIIERKKWSLHFKTELQMIRSEFAQSQTGIDPKVFRKVLFKLQKVLAHKVFSPWDYEKGLRWLERKLTKEKYPSIYCDVCREARARLKKRLEENQKASFYLFFEDLSDILIELSKEKLTQEECVSLLNYYQSSIPEAVYQSVSQLFQALLVDYSPQEFPYITVENEENKKNGPEWQSACEKTYAKMGVIFESYITQQKLSSPGDALLINTDDIKISKSTVREMIFELFHSTANKGWNYTKCHPKESLIFIGTAALLASYKYEVAFQPNHNGVFYPYSAASITPFNYNYFNPPTLFGVMAISFGSMQQGFRPNDIITRVPTGLIGMAYINMGKCYANEVSQYFKIFDNTADPKSIRGISIQAIYPTENGGTKIVGNRGQGGFGVFVGDVLNNGTINSIFSFKDYSYYTSGVYAAYPALEGGTVVVGGYYPGYMTNETALIAKIFNDGSLVWGISLQGDASLRALDVYPAFDNSSILAGISYSKSKYGGALVGKVFENGTLSWAAQFGTIWDDAYAVQPTPNGGILVGGNTFINGDLSDALVAQISANGTLNWAARLGIIGSFKDACATSDGGTVLVGAICNSNCDSIHSLGIDILVAKIFENGTLSWATRVGSPNLSEAAFVVDITQDESIVLAGSSYIDGDYGLELNSVLFAKMSGDGRLNWITGLSSFTQNSHNFAVLSDPTGIHATVEGGAVIGGPIYYNYIPDTYLVKVDANGQTQTSNCFNLQPYQASQTYLSLNMNYITSNVNFSFISPIVIPISISSISTQITENPCYLTTTGTTGEELPSSPSYTKSIVGGIIGGVVLCGVSIGGGYYAYRRYQANKQRQRELERQHLEKEKRELERQHLEKEKRELERQHLEKEKEAQRKIQLENKKQEEKRIEDQKKMRQEQEELKLLQEILLKLRTAIQENNVKIVQNLLSEGITSSLKKSLLSHRDVENNLFLHHAVLAGNKKIVKFLIHEMQKQNIALTLTNKSGATAQELVLNNSTLFDLFPPSESAYLKRARIHLENGNLHGANTDCDQAIALESSNITAYEIRIEANISLQKLGQPIDYKRQLHKKVIVDCIQVIKLSATQAPKFYAVKANEEFQLGQIVESILSYQKASELGEKVLAPQALKPYSSKALSAVKKLKNDDPAVQFEVAEMFLYGTDGFPKSAITAKDLLEKSAHQDYNAAQYLLGTLYEDGCQDIIKDINQALMWYQKAATRQHLQAGQALQRLKQGTSSSQSNFKNEIIDPNVLAKSPLMFSLAIKYDEIKLGKEVGRGGFGIVYQGIYRFNDVAIKQLHLAKPSLEALDEFKQEMQLMANLRYPQIVQLYGVYTEPSYGIVMEYMPNGSLYSVLHNKKTLEWTVRYSIATDMSKGVAFLHKENILHRDLKSPNVLLDQYMRAKLTDFGLAKVKNETNSISSSEHKVVGTLLWMAPELFKRNQYTKESDIYSLGMTLWELASRELPFKDAINRDLIPKLVCDGEREEMPKETPPQLARMITWCWDGEAAKRPNADQVVEELTKEVKVNDNSEPLGSQPKYFGNLSGFNSALSQK